MLGWLAAECHSLTDSLVRVFVPCLVWRHPHQLPTVQHHQEDHSAHAHRCNVCVKVILDTAVLPFVHLQLGRTQCCPQDQSVATYLLKYSAWQLTRTPSVTVTVTVTLLMFFFSALEMCYCLSVTAAAASTIPVTSNITPITNMSDNKCIKTCCKHVVQSGPVRSQTYVIVVFFYSCQWICYWLT